VIHEFVQQAEGDSGAATGFGRREVQMVLEAKNQKLRCFTHQVPVGRDAAERQAAVEDPLRCHLVVQVQDAENSGEAWRLLLFCCT